MVFSKTESKPAEGTAFDISTNDSLKPSVLSMMDYYHGADLSTPGIEYPEGYIPPVQPALEPAITEVSLEEAVEETPDPRVRDNGLGIMVVDYPEAEPNISDNRDESESILESTSETVLYKTPISYKKLAVSGLKKIVKTAKELPAYATQKLSANIITGLGGLAEKVTMAEHKTARKRLAVVALGGLAVAAAAYATSKGLNLSHTSRAHEALQPAIPAKAPHHVAEALQAHPLKASDAISPVIHHSQKAAKLKPAADNLSQTFTIESGHGFTQEISESFSPKASRLSPLKSYHLFSAMRQHFGDHGMLKHGKGLVDGTYNRNGEEFISRPGRAQWAPGVAKFARQWLNTHAS